MFNETMSSKKLTHYVITLYHTTSTLLIQGSQRTVWVKKEFSIRKAVLRHHRNHGTSNINDAYNHLLKIPKEHQPTEQQLAGEPAKTLQVLIPQTYQKTKQKKIQVPLNSKLKIHHPHLFKISLIQQ